ncbi:MAG: cupin domain-containing protein [Chromatocurvus sp.]
MFKPGSVVVKPEDRLSLWQPMPSRGHVDLILTPDNMPYDTFASGTQVLPPGCYVRQHGHTQNHELIFIYEGEGMCTIDGTDHDLEPGTTVLFARNSVHLLKNTGKVDLKLFWVFFPPGLDDWFKAIGRPRTPGEPMPEPFDRPEDVQEVMRKLKFMPPKPDSDTA